MTIGTLQLVSSVFLYYYSHSHTFTVVCSSWSLWRASKGSPLNAYYSSPNERWWAAQSWAAWNVGLLWHQSGCHGIQYALGSHCHFLRKKGHCGGFFCNDRKRGLDSMVALELHHFCPILPISLPYHTSSLPSLHPLPGMLSPTSPHGFIYSTSALPDGNSTPTLWQKVGPALELAQWCWPTVKACKCVFWHICDNAYWWYCKPVFRALDWTLRHG